MKAQRRRSRGVAIIEFALIVPFLVILAAITTEFGRALHQYNSIAKSVRDGARYLSTQAPNTQVEQARNLIVFGTLGGGGQPLVHGLTTGHVPDPVWMTAGSDPVINTVTVEVRDYDFVPMFAAVFGLNFPAMRFSPIRATMRSAL